MGCNTDMVRDNLEQHMKMSTDNNNPYPTAVSVATAHILSYETAKQKKTRKQGTKQDNNGYDAKG